jgi:hypothetical protein
MATLSKAKVQNIGVIAEDASDVDVVVEILKKFAPENQFQVKKFVGNGCGKLRNKCQSWADVLFKKGCNHVFILHDLDRNKEAELRATLQAKVPMEKYPNSLIVIPVEELEAWLLSDETALQYVFSLKERPKRYKNCEDIKSPKEEIGRLIWSKATKRYINTVHNKKIAEKTSLENFRRCTSFKSLDSYLQDNVFKNG